MDLRLNVLQFFARLSNATLSFRLLHFSIDNLGYGICRSLKSVVCNIPFGRLRLMR